jgi:pimeloyl-ACP methyl ester carboxylesterase/DNA-binding CsgD family transcriptional regulator
MGRTVVAEDIRAEFCRLPSGAQVAFAAMGAGSPLVMVPGWLCHLEQSWSHPAAASARAKFASAHRFVWYDRLGCGLSDRDGFEISLENDVEQLVAVLDAAGIERANLIGYSFGAPPAAVFAARYPERVNRLVFYSAFARRHTAPEAREAIVHLIRTSWVVGSRALATMLLPNASSRDLTWFARFQREATTGAMAACLLEHQWEMDVRDVLPGIRAPTLVAHNVGDRAVPVEEGREIAALVPGAEWYEFGGNEHDPFIRDSGSVVDVILDFVNGRPIEPSRVVERRSPDPLTAREQEVLVHIAAGATNREIATDLDIAVKTVERHVTNIYRKLDAGGRVDATRAAVAMGLVSP